jgi:hypothetical protein
MSFCEHCDGQRFDRARVLKTLRALGRAYRSERRGRSACEAIDAAIQEVRRLDLPHLEQFDDESTDGEVVH